MSKKTLIIIAAVVLGIVGFFIFTQPAPEATADPSQHKYSEGSTGIVLMEYADFQCPACASYYPVVTQVKEKYKDLITFQFRHFPLESIHQNARAAARAAEAANIQGKFWEMHDYLYENQSAWQSTGDPLTLFKNYAQAIGIEDINKFEADYRSSTVNAVINADLDTGRELGATSTPSFVLDGKLLDENPAPTLEAFSALLDEKIREKTGQDPVFSNTDANTNPETETQSTETQETSQ